MSLIKLNRDKFNEYARSEWVDYYIVFTNSNYDHWLFRFLKPGYRHVYAMKKTEHGNFWQIINPKASHLSVHQELVSVYPTPEDYAEPGDVIVPVSKRIYWSDNKRPLGIYTCVEVIKSLLCIKKPWVFTPYQLYRSLKNE